MGVAIDFWKKIWVAVLKRLRTTDVYYIMCRCNTLILKFTKKSMALEFIQSRNYDTADS